MTISEMSSFWSRKVSLEGIVLLTVSLADTVQTAFVVQLGLASELNPVMRLLLEHSLPTFISAKIAILTISIVALELLRGVGTSRSFARFWQWVAITVYSSAVLLGGFLLPYARVLWGLI